MSNDPRLQPRVYPTGDGERSTAGSNYGDWRPSHPPTPNGYDFEKRFQRRWREEHGADAERNEPDAPAGSGPAPR